MKTDTRITIAFALVYVLNGIYNMQGTGVFSPMVYIDWFLLGTLSLIFFFLPPIKLQNLIFVLFALFYSIEGGISFGIVTNETISWVNLILFIATSSFLYAFPIIKVSAYRVYLAIPMLLFLLTMVFSLLELNSIFILITGIFLAFYQVLLLAKPPILEQIPLVIKRFYLLMTLSVFYDLVLNLYYQLIK